jgi:putative transcriptional regulator
VTPTSHPDLLLLGAYAFGQLETAPSLVVATHARGCVSCQEAVRAFEALGGGLLADGPIEDIPLDRLRRALEAAERNSPLPATDDAVEADDLRWDLAGWPMLRRWRFPNGIWAARIVTPATERWRAFVIGAPAGAQLPEHWHEGQEFTCVVEGELEEDDAIVYRKGDFTDGGIDRPHRLRISAAGPGVALLATEARLRWRGPMAQIGRLLGL